jgi:hypothetical protein
MQDNHEEKRMPTEEEQRCDCAYVKEQHEAEDGPIEDSRLCVAAESLWLMRRYFRVGCGGGMGVECPAGVNSIGLVGENGGSRCCESRHASRIKLKRLCFCRSFVIASCGNQNRPESIAFLLKLHV